MTIIIHRFRRSCTGTRPIILMMAGLMVSGPLAAQDQAATAATPTSDVPPQLGEIVVTARKRKELLARVPTSITAFTSQALQDFHITSFDDYATKTPNLSFSYGGGPTGIADSRTIAIRGITGQNLFGTSGATGFYIDDTPMPSSIDPRIVDIDNIEVLKGPQGTLYGESSLGGNVKLVTKQPSMAGREFDITAQGGITSGGGSPDGGASIVANLPIRDDIAVRIVAFGNHDAGYLTRTYPTDPTSPGVTDPFLAVPRTSVDNQGAIGTFGGSATALWNVTDRFSVELRIMHQEQTDNGFPAAFAPLPSFTPVYTLNRAFNVQPSAADRWTMPSIVFKYSADTWDFVSSTSYFHRRTQDVEDSTYGTQQILSSYYQVTGLPAQPYLWDGEHYFNQVSSESRLTFQPNQIVSGTAGVFFSNARALFVIPPTNATGLPAATATDTFTGPWPNDLLWTQSNPGTQKDYSIFGEVYLKFLPRLTLTLGARQYWLEQFSDYTANGFMNFGPTPSNPQSNRQSGTNPKVGVSYQATRATMVYASASKGFRAGGAQAYLPFCAEANLPVDDITHLKSDTLWSYEAGTKIQLTDPGLLITADAFHIDWSNIQQQVALPCGSYFDINGGRAKINGGELEAVGYAVSNLQIRFGLGYENTDMTDPGALGLVGLPAGSRIMGVPAWTATAGAVYRRPLTGVLSGFLSADYSFTGNSQSLLNGGYGAIATRPSYSLVDARIGIDWDTSELSLNGSNLTNAKPNLGDIGYVGYAQYTANSTVIPQVATLRPVSLIIEYTRSF